MKQFLIALILAASAAAQPAIRPPQMGFASDAQGALRPVYGVAGNFILGAPVAGKVISEAFGGSLGLWKTESALEVFDGQGRVFGSINVAAGPALFAFAPDGVTALAYIESSKTLLRMARGQVRGNASPVNRYRGRDRDAECF